MSELPISFILSAVLVLVLVRYSLFSERRIGLLPRMTLVALALQSALLGLRWGYHYNIVWPVQSVIAALIPPLTWLALNSMVSGTNWRMTQQSWLQLAASPLLVIWAPLIGPKAVDIVICAVFILYGVALLYTTFREDIEWLDRIPFQSVVTTYTVFRAAGLVLILSAFVDGAISYDMATNGGDSASNIVGLSSLVIVVILGASIAMVGSLAPEMSESEIIPDIAEVPELTERSAEEMHALHVETLARLDALMISKRVYRDPNLSLNRIARKLVVPSRQISSAINSQRAINVPQYVNMFRVVEACQFLSNSSVQITAVIFEVGFQTKSNFNREFQRIVGMSPSEWRQSKTGDSVPESMKPFIARLQTNRNIIEHDISALFPKNLS